MTTTARREKGAGHLSIRTDAAGRRTWYGKVTVGGRQVKKVLGRVRDKDCRDGLTETQARAALRTLATTAGGGVPREHRITVAEAGEVYIDHLQGVKGRKPTTITDYRTILRHFVKFTQGRTLDRIDGPLLEAYTSAKLAEGLSHKTIRNHLTFLGGLYRFALRRKWVTSNPVAEVDMPEGGTDHVEIRFLTPEELAALYRAAPRPDDDADDDDPERVCAAFWPTDRVLFMTAAMTGLRQGELIGLRWRDVDWSIGQVRVRQSFTHGAWSSPKSRKGRAAPMADSLAGELERHHRTSRFQADDDLVFGHPVLGSVLDSSAMRKRFKRALSRADLREVRFHDLRHSFGTAMAATGAPMRAIQAWMGHASITTTEIYADYSPDPSGGAEWARRAFDQDPHGTGRGTNLTETQVTSANYEPL